MQIKFAAPILALLLLASAGVQAQVNYAISNNIAYVAAGSRASSGSPSGAITISNTYQGYPVTLIGPSAFAGATALTSVLIPDSVTNIGASAFESCIALTNASLPANVISIGEQAFLGCPALSDVAIPNSVTTIGAEAYFDCFGVTNLTFSEGVTSIGAGHFSEIPIWSASPSRPVLPASARRPLWNAPASPIFPSRRATPTTAASTASCSISIKPCSFNFFPRSLEIT